MYKHFSTRYNLWDNMYLTSKSIAKFYHIPNIKFGLTHPSDEDIIRTERLQRDSDKRMENVDHREGQKKLQKTRQLEREILQRESSQPCNFDCERLEASLTPEVRKQIVYKKSVTFLNPAKEEKLPSNCLYNYHNFTERQKRLLLLPPILKMDYRNSIINF